jgi:excisionase family DNA binding protein
MSAWSGERSTALRFAGLLWKGLPDWAMTGRVTGQGGRVSTKPSESELLLTPAEVAGMFRVDPKTVTRWAKAGKLSSIRTLGGHRRYRESEVRALLGGTIPEQRSGGATQG